ncbi:hypothetical protein Q427_16065 [Halomonas sp. BC04]|nr:hypothetical protein Q427_16065 [Halomonas sp. BC04]
MQVGGGVLGGTHAAGGLEAHVAPACLDRGEQDPGGIQGGIDGYLAGGGLEEIGTAVDGEHAGPVDQPRLLELAGFKDHLEHGIAALPLAGGDQFTAYLGIARHQGAIREDHVDLVGTGGDGRAGLGRSTLDVCVAVGEVGHRGHLHLAGQALLGQCILAVPMKAGKTHTAAGCPAGVLARTHSSRMTASLSSSLRLVRSISVRAWRAACSSSVMSLPVK